MRKKVGRVSLRHVQVPIAHAPEEQPKYSIDDREPRDAQGLLDVDDRTAGYVTRCGARGKPLSDR